MTPTHEYSVFGLAVRSELDLPELMRASIVGEPDVTIRIGQVAGEDLLSPGLQANGDLARLSIPGVGVYSIERGSDITVEPATGVDPRNVRLFLLGSAFGAMLHQRGLLPLHANAVEVGGQAIAFMGASGSGKSTLASWFHDQGFRVLSDDVCVVDFADAGRPSVRPGIARLRLWREALAATGRIAEDHQASFVGANAPDKFDVSISQTGSADDQIPLAAIYLLDRGERQGIQRLSGGQAVEAIFANTYRGSFIEHVGKSQDHWSRSVELVQSIPTFRAVRVWGLAELKEQSAALLKHAAETVAAHNKVA